MYNLYIGKLLDVVTSDTAVCYASITCARVLPGALALGFVGPCVERPAGISVGIVFGGFKESILAASHWQLKIGMARFPPRVQLEIANDQTLLLSLKRS